MQSSLIKLQPPAKDNQSCHQVIVKINQKKGLPVCEYAYSVDGGAKLCSVDRPRRLGYVCLLDSCKLTFQKSIVHTHTQLDRRRWGYLGLWRPETAGLIKPWLFSVTMSAVQYFEMPGLWSAQKTVRDQIWVFPTAGQIYKFPPLSEADLWNFRFQLTLHHKIYSPRSYKI